MEKNNTSVEELNREFVRTGYKLRVALVISAGLTILLLILSIFFILQNQQQVKQTLQETKNQSLVNQKYIRCIILLPASSFQGSNEQRAAAIDNCAVQSKLPNNAKAN